MDLKKLVMFHKNSDALSSVLESLDGGWIREDQAEEIIQMGSRIKGFAFPEQKKVSHIDFSKVEDISFMETKLFSKGFARKTLFLHRLLSAFPDGKKLSAFCRFIDRAVEENDVNSYTFSGLAEASSRLMAEWEMGWLGSEHIRQAFFFGYFENEDNASFKVWQDIEDLQRQGCTLKAIEKALGREAGQKEIQALAAFSRSRGGDAKKVLEFIADSKDPNITTLTSVLEYEMEEYGTSLEKALDGLERAGFRRTSNPAWMKEEFALSLRAWWDTPEEAMEELNPDGFTDGKVFMAVRKIREEDPEFLKDVSVPENMTEDGIKAVRIVLGRAETLVHGSDAVELVLSSDADEAFRKALAWTLEQEPVPDDAEFSGIDPARASQSPCLKEYLRTWLCAGEPELAEKMLEAGDPDPSRMKAFSGLLDVRFPFLKEAEEVFNLFGKNRPEGQEAGVIRNLPKILNLYSDKGSIGDIPVWHFLVETAGKEANLGDTCRLAILGNVFFTRLPEEWPDADAGAEFVYESSFKDDILFMTEDDVLPFLTPGLNKIQLEEFLRIRFRAGRGYRLSLGWASPEYSGAKLALIRKIVSDYCANRDIWGSMWTLVSQKIEAFFNRLSPDMEKDQIADLGRKILF